MRSEAVAAMSGARLRSYTKRNEAVAAIRDDAHSEGLALILVAFYDLALEVCAAFDVQLTDRPPIKPHRRARADE